MSREYFLSKKEVDIYNVSSHYLIMNNEIVTLNPLEPERLFAVRTKMAHLGSPVVHAVWSPANCIWVALEGSHRLAMAEELGVPVEIAEVEYSDTAIGECSWSDVEDRDLTIAEIVDSAIDRYRDGLYVTVEVV